MATKKKRASARKAASSLPSAEDRVVHVRMPRSVAFDLRSFQRIQKDILGRLGCQACCSGFDIRWDFVRGFAVDEKLGITELVDAGKVRG